MIDNEQLLEALDRIARTPDGEFLYLYLQRIMMELVAAPNADVGALHEHHGRRRLAAELIGRMAKGMTDSGGRTDPASPGRAERAVIFAPRQPASLGGARQSAREFIAASDPELKSSSG